MMVSPGEYNRLHPYHVMCSSRSCHLFLQYVSLDSFLPPHYFLFCLSSHSLFSYLLQEEDFHEMVRTSEVMENQYGHLFDKVIVNDELSAAFGELRMALRTVETEEIGRAHV